MQKKGGKSDSFTNKARDIMDKNSKLSRWMPVWGWLRSYRKEDIPGDLSAGVTVAVMLIPQGMAYAMLAGLPPIIGLYASIIPLFIYALFGTSRQLAVGPVAMVSLLVATGVGKIASTGSTSYLMYAVLLAGMVGVIQLVMGLARLGFLVNFLSHPVISGFTSAAALIIGFSQLKYLMGVELARSHHVHTLVWNAIQKIPEIHVMTFVIGLGGIVALVLFKKWKPAFPGALVTVVTGTLVVWGFGLHGSGVSIVGKVPSGLPSPTIPTLDLNTMQVLLPTALVISFVGFMESISVAKAFASRNGYKVDANQELIGLGLANIAGTFFQSYPVTGGFSRTAVNAQAGARTGLASIITAVLIAVSILFFTPLFFFLPKALLASIVIVAVSGLVDFQELKHLWKVKRSDAALLLLTFFATLTLGIETGILVGVFASLGVFIYRSTTPHTAELGYLEGEDVYRNVLRFPEAEKNEEIAIVRIDASFYFANVAFFQDYIEKLVQCRKDTLKTVILDASGINDLDASAEHALREISGMLKEKEIQLFFASVKGPVRDVMHRSGLYQVVGEDFFTFSIQEAVRRSQSEEEEVRSLQALAA